VHRIGEHQFERLGEDSPDRLPIDPRRLHREVGDRLARQPARQPLQFRSCRAKRLDVLLYPTAAGQTDAGQTDAGQTDAGQTDAGQTDAGQTNAGHDAVTVDIEAGATRMKYLHHPSSLRRRRGAHEIEL
jgi:hypothetical protein